MTNRDASPIDIEDTDPPPYRGDWQAARMPGRFGSISIVGGPLASEAGVRAAIAKLTAWLDAPRLAAREKPDVVAEFTDEFGTRTYLVHTTAGEWGVGDSHELAPVSWGDEADARDLFREVTNTDACELCGTYRDDHDVDEDGIYTCTDEHKAACEAACATKGPTP